MTPAIRALRKRYPQAFIACAVPPRCRELLAGNPHLDEIVEIDERGAERGLLGFWRVVRRIRSYRFDACYLFHRSLTRTLWAFLAGIPHRVGYATWKRRALLTTAVPMPPKDTVPKTVYFLDLLKADGIVRDGTAYDLAVSESDRAYARQLLRAAGCQADRPTIAIHAGANWLLKRWPPASFARLGDLLAEQYGAQVVLVGSADDRPMAEGIARRMDHPPVILSGQTTLSQLGALFMHVDAVISNDSGPLHIAAAVGARVVGLFGPTSPELTGPPGGANVQVLVGSIGCPVPCYRLWCPINLCLRQITPERVVEAILRWPEPQRWRHRTPALP